MHKCRHCAVHLPPVKAKKPGELNETTRACTSQACDVCGVRQGTSVWHLGPREEGAIMPARNQSNVVYTSLMRRKRLRGRGQHECAAQTLTPRRVREGGGGRQPGAVGWR